MPDETFQDALLAAILRPGVFEQVLALEIHIDALDPEMVSRGLDDGTLEICTTDAPGLYVRFTEAARARALAPAPIDPVGGEA